MLRTNIRATRTSAIASPLGRVPALNPQLRAQKALSCTVVPSSAVSRIPGKKQREMVGFSLPGKADLDRAVDGWTCADIPDLTGKVALITGSSSGLGLETASALAKAGCKVYLVAHKQERADQNVTEFLRKFRKVSKGENLDILFLNHGIFFPGEFALTPDGFEQTVGTNYYSQVVMVMGLLDRLAESAPSRVVFQCSEAEAFGQLDWDNLKGNHFDNSGLIPYGTSKLMQLMFAQKLQELVRSKNIDVFAVHPGLVKTPLLGKMDIEHYFDGAVFYAVNSVIGLAANRGALPGIYAASAEDVAGKGYKYFGPSGYLNLNLFPYEERVAVNPKANDPPAFNRLFVETTRILESILGSNEWGPVAKAAAKVIEHVPSGARI